MPVMEINQLLSRFENLRRDPAHNRPHGDSARHKPLLVLMMLARLKNEGTEKLPFLDIEPVLVNLLKAFERHTNDDGKYGDHRYRADYPFWRLQNDRVWVVDVKPKEVLGRGGQPRIRDLRKKNPKAGFTRDILRALDSPGAIDELANYLLMRHFILEERIRLRQALGLTEFQFLSPSLPTVFQRSVLRAYQSKCAMCHRATRVMNRLIDVHATYIQHPEHGGTYNTNNGLALCSHHHVHFVQGAFSLESQQGTKYRVLVADPREEKGLGYDFNGKGKDHFELTEMKKKDRPVRQFLEWHRNHIFLQNLF